MDFNKEINFNKGKEAELRFKKQLDKHLIPYLYIQQDTEKLFLQHLKINYLEKGMIL